MKIRSERFNNRRFLANQVVDKQRDTFFADPENYDLVAAFFISAVLNFEYLPQTQQGNGFTPQMEQLTSFETVELGGTNARGFHHGAQRESIDLVSYLHEQIGKNGYGQRHPHVVTRAIPKRRSPRPASLTTRSSAITS